MLWGQRSTWGHLGSHGSKVIFTKNATSTDYMAWLCNSCIYIHKLETLYSIHGVKVNLGGTSASKYHATVSRSVSRSSSSGQHFIDLYLRHELTDFDQTWSQVPVDHPIYVICPRLGVKCHVGVTGVKKGIFTKNATVFYRLRSMITWLMYVIELETLYKSYALIFYRRSFGSQGS